MPTTRAVLKAWLAERPGDPTDPLDSRGAVEGLVALVTTLDTVAVLRSDLSAVGAIADRYGIEHTLVGLALIPLAAAAVAMLLPARAPSLHATVADTPA